jgi:hypothetical protein
MFDFGTLKVQDHVGQVQWLTSVIQTTQEVEIRRIEVQDESWQQS